MNDTFETEETGIETWLAWIDGCKEDAVEFEVGPFDDFPAAVCRALGVDVFGEEVNVKRVSR